MSEVAIEVKNLKKYFHTPEGEVRAVDDVSFHINKGEIVGLVGESGSGKTTLARTILGLTRMTDGSVIFDGTDMAKASRRQMKELRHKVSVVFQDPASNLNPRETVISSITRPLILQGISRREAAKKAEKALELVKMDKEYLYSYPHQLSGGQLQRIAIARAVVIEPQVMILDEPTSALDISVQAQILNLLLDLQEKLQLTYLIITHDLNVIRYISDRVAVMYLGRLVEYGPTQEVIGNPKHPYTQGLMAALPILNPRDRGKKKELMNSEPGSLIDLPKGCHFNPRCPYATDRCREKFPESTVVAPGYQVACYRAEPLGQNAQG